VEFHEREAEGQNYQLPPKLISEMKILWTMDIPQGYCKRLSNSMPNMIQQVLAAKGEAASTENLHEISSLVIEMQST
jgi:hypothetical protein